jgi:hypothetical protein
VVHYVQRATYSTRVIALKLQTSKRCSLLSVIVFLSYLLLAGCRPPPLLSYPWFWDYTRTKPKDADLVGAYKILKVRLPSDLDRLVREKDPVLTLNGDHTATLIDVPEFDGFGDDLVCRLSGSANWSLGRSGGLGWSVGFQNYHPATTPTTRKCQYENSVWDILVLSQNAPYRLYSSVGDPDSDTGIEFNRVGR